MTAPIELHWVQRPGRPVVAVRRPATLIEALQMLAEEPAALPLAGGTDLLLELARGGPGPGASLIDLTAISGFTSIHENPDSFVLEGGVTHNDVVANAAIVEQALPLAQACLEIGSPQLRNRATVAGNVATASPANDSISALVALGASVRVAALDSGDVHSTTVPIDQFFTGFRETALRLGELIEAIRVPRLAPSQRGIWVKLGLRKAQAISVVHAGLVVDLDDSGVVIDARIALGSVSATVGLSAPAAEVLIGSPLTDRQIRRASVAAADSVTPIDDVRATAEYRSDAVVTVVSRGLRALAEHRERERWPARPVRLSSRPLPLPERRRSAQPPPSRTIDDTTQVAMTVNGEQVSGGRAAGLTLLDWLRNNAGTGTKEGCAEGECGACTVNLDGDAVMSCLVAAAQADGATVTTIEGLAGESDAHPMQATFVEKFAVQCGFCIPGFVMAASALVDEIASPSHAEIELALSGNLCRCTGYYSIIDAVGAAASEVRP